MFFIAVLYCMPMCLLERKKFKTENYQKKLQNNHKEIELHSNITENFMMPKVYLKIFRLNQHFCYVCIENLIVLFTLKFCDSKLQIALVKSRERSSEKSVSMNISEFQYE